jgi:cation:H+ antiporter
MNMVSSNINQWTLLAAMLPIVYSLSRGTVSAIPLDGEQELELLLTLSQSLLAACFLVEMRLAWWEAGGLFFLWAVQFAFSPVAPGPGLWGFVAAHIREAVTACYLGWAAVEIFQMWTGGRKARAFSLFGVMWKRHVRSSAIE